MKVTGLFALGFGYLFGLLACLAGLLLVFILLALTGKGTVLAIKFSLPIIWLLYIGFKSLWIRVPRPEGKLLERKDHQELFRMVDELRKASNSPKVHEILLDGDFNASVIQIPRLGILGWQKNYLIIGLPLLLALPAEEFKAVLAHELGHLSRSHSRFSMWIYRARKSWLRILEQLQQEARTGAFFYMKFLTWYIPKLDKHSFALARLSEYEADHFAAQMMGRRSVVSALLRIHLVGNWLQEHYWPNIQALAGEQPKPANPFKGMLAQFTSVTFEEPSLASLMYRESSAYDTHPSLKERLDILGEQAFIPDRLKVSAAEFYIPDRLSFWMDNIGQEWMKNVEASWVNHYDKVRKSRDRFNELEALSQQRTLEVQELWELAQLMGELKGEEEAWVIYEEIVHREPAFAPARYEVGRMLLKRRDESGIGHLEEAISLDPRATVACCQLICSYLESEGRKIESIKYITMIQKWEQARRENQEDRNQIKAEDHFEYHQLESAALHNLVTYMSGIRHVKKWYIVRKRLRHFPENPLYVMGIVPSRTVFLRKRSASQMNRLLQQVAQSGRLPGETIVVNLTNHRSIHKKLKSVQDVRPS